MKPIILLTGQFFVVECARIREEEGSPVQEFLKSIDVKDRAKVISLIKRFADFGKITNREQFKKVEDIFWEFKSFQIRVFMYHCGKGHVCLTHGFIKKGDRIPKSEIERAYKIKELYEEIRRR